jgi:hypothetical protein
MHDIKSLMVLGREYFKSTNKYGMTVNRYFDGKNNYKTSGFFFEKRDLKC